MRYCQKLKGHLKKHQISIINNLGCYGAAQDPYFLKHTVITRATEQVDLIGYK